MPRDDSQDQHDDLVAHVLSGTPERVTDVVVPESAMAEVDAVRATLGTYARATTAPVHAPERVRDKLRAAIAAHPRQARRAVVVLDMIADYLTPGLPLHVPRALAIIEPIRTRIEAARKSGEPVIYLCDHHEAGDPDLEAWPHHAVHGTPRERVVAPLAPHDGDVVIGHRTYSAFFETELERTLDGLNVDTLELTGCATEIGLLATATDALMRGFRVEVPPGTQAGGTEVAERVALGVLHVMRPLPRGTTPRASGSRSAPSR